MSKTLNRYVVPLVCIGLVIAFFVVNRSSEGPRFGHEGDTDRYHWQVRQALDRLEQSSSDWQATKVDVKPAAAEVRNPNIVFSRRFTNRQTNIQAEVLLVQSKDIRDMAGYIPENYYPANGYSQTDQTSQYWHVDDLDIFGRRFTFLRPENQTGNQLCIVDQFVILPNGQITGELEIVAQSADNSTVSSKDGRMLGAAQIHVITDGDLTEQQREATFTDLMRTFQGVIETIRSGADG